MAERASGKTKLGAKSTAVETGKGARPEGFGASRDSEASANTELRQDRDQDLGDQGARQDQITLSPQGPTVHFRGPQGPSVASKGDTGPTGGRTHMHACMHTCMHTHNTHTALRFLKARQETGPTARVTRPSASAAARIRPGRAAAGARSLPRSSPRCRRS